MLTPEQAADQIDQFDFRFDPGAGGVLAMATLASAGLASDPQAGALSHALDVAQLLAPEHAQQLSGTDYALSLLGAPGTSGLLEIAQSLGGRPSADLLLMGLPETRHGEVFAAAPTYILHAVGAPDQAHATLSLRISLIREGQDLCLFLDPVHAMGPEGPGSEAVAALLGAAAASAAGRLVSSCLFDADQAWNLLYFIPDISEPGPEVSDEDAFQDRTGLAFVEAFPDQAITETECEQARVDIQDLEPDEPGYWVEHLHSRASLTVFVAGAPMTRPDTTGAFQALQRRLPRLAELAG